MPCLNYTIGGQQNTQSMLKENQTWVKVVLGSSQYATIVTTSQPNRSVPQVEQETGGGLGQVTPGQSGGYTGTGGGGNPSGTTSTIGTSVTIKCKAASILGAQDRQVSLQIRGVDSGTTQTKLINLLRN